MTVNPEEISYFYDADDDDKISLLLRKKWKFTNSLFERNNSHVKIYNVIKLKLNLKVFLCKNLLSG